MMTRGPLASVAMGRRGGNQRLLIRFASLWVIIVAVLAFHARGSSLELLRVGRIVVVAVVVLGAGLVARRRGPR